MSNNSPETIVRTFMSAQTYQKIKTKIETLRSSYPKISKILKILYGIGIFFLYILILIISLPQYIFLGPTASFELFARREPSGTWLDSYAEYVTYHKITLAGILFILGLVIWGLLVYFLFPILFFEIGERLGRTLIK